MDYASKGPGVKHGFMAPGIVKKEKKPKQKKIPHSVLLIFVCSLDLQAQLSLINNRVRKSVHPELH